MCGGMQTWGANFFWYPKRFWSVCFFYCDNCIWLYKTKFLFWLLVFVLAQSEPLYVPVKFQDVPAEHSNGLIGDCESCECKVDVAFMSCIYHQASTLCFRLNWTDHISNLTHMWLVCEGGQLWKRQYNSRHLSFSRPPDSGLSSHRHHNKTNITSRTVLLCLACVLQLNGTIWSIRFFSCWASVQGKLFVFWMELKSSFQNTCCLSGSCCSVFPPVLKIHYALAAVKRDRLCIEMKW